MVATPENRGRQDFARRPTVVNVRRMNEDYNKATDCIYYNMSLAAPNQFAPVKPRFRGGFRRPLDRLAVDDSGTGILVSPLFRSDLPANFGIDPRQNLAVSPFVIVVAHERIKRESISANTATGNRSC